MGGKSTEHLAAHWAISKDLYRYLNLNGLDIVIGILYSRSADWKHLPVSFTAVLREKNEG